MSRTIDRSPGADAACRLGDGLAHASTKGLLMCSIASSLLYGVMIWVIRYNGYSPISQTVKRAVRMGHLDQTALAHAWHGLGDPPGGRSGAGPSSHSAHRSSPTRCLNACGSGSCFPS
jgi:hypothetical protein